MLTRSGRRSRSSARRGRRPLQPRSPRAISATAAFRARSRLRTAVQRLRRPALASCGKLGPARPLDCAQGVLHDYWIAVAGLDGTRRPTGTVTSPRKLCGASRPATSACAGIAPSWCGRRRRRPRRLPACSRPCRGLTGLQFDGCLTGASLIRSDDPLEQLRTCGGLAGSEGADCLRGLRVQAYALAPPRYDSA